MADEIKFTKGLKVDLPNLLLAEPGFVTDEKRLYIGGPTGNIPLPNKEDLDGINASLSERVKQLGGGFLINGDFRFNQRTVSGTVTLTVGQYGHDRWKAGASGCTYTFTTSGGVTTITITAGSLIQVIEGINLQTGTYVLSWGGTAQGKIGAGSYSASGATSSITGGTNLTIEFGIGTLFNVKLEKGTVATPFVPRSYGEEFGLCLRYFQKANIRGIATTTGTLMSASGFTIRMRTSPTPSNWDTQFGTSSIGYLDRGTFANSYFNSYGLDSLTTSATLTVGRLYSINVDLDAEL